VTQSTIRHDNSIRLESHSDAPWVPPNCRQIETYLQFSGMRSSHKTAADRCCMLCCLLCHLEQQVPGPVRLKTKPSMLRMIHVWAGQRAGCTSVQHAQLSASSWAALQVTGRTTCPNADRAQHLRAVVMAGRRRAIPVDNVQCKATLCGAPHAGGEPPIDASPASGKIAVPCERRPDASVYSAVYAPGGVGSISAYR
jgi:hypothetical protein